MDSAEIRRANLKALIEEHGASRVGETLGMERSQLSQIAGRNPTRNIGPTLARRIETAFSKPRGWLDTAHNTAAKPASRPNIVDVPKLSIRASAGAGVVQPDNEYIVGSMQVPMEWIRRNIHCTTPQNLRTIMAYGDSMADTFNDGDIVWVDIGVKQIDVDGVYVVVVERELFIKRFQRRPLEQVIWMISDNKTKYERQVISRNALKHVEVLGRAVWVWNGKKL